MKPNEMDKKTYQQYAKQRAQKSPLFKDCIAAFLVGGAICTLAEALHHLYTYFGMNMEDASALVSISLIFLAALLTGIGIFDDIARVAGAGTLVPITGFSNAVAAPAVDTKSDERDIIGLSRKAP